MGTKQARGPRGERWGQEQEDAGAGGRLEPSESLLRTQALCQGGLAVGGRGSVKCEGADAGWKRDFTSPMC